MANYVPHFRSSYFEVKSMKRFKQFCNIFGLRMHERGPTVAIFGDEGMPNNLWAGVGTDAEDRSIDFPAHLAKFLKPGHGAVMQEIGYEKERYYFGMSCAVNWKGDCEYVHLDDIYDRIDEKLEGQFTDCTY